MHNHPTHTARNIPVSTHVSSKSIELQIASSIQPEPIPWLWPKWLALGKFHIIAGAPSSGKTAATLELAAILSAGGLDGKTWPDGTFAPISKVVIWTGEDGIEDTIIPRLIAAGANLSMIHIIKGTFENGHRRSFDFKKDIRTLEWEMSKLRNVRLLIIDSIVQAVSGDSNKNTDVRNALEPIVAMAEAHNCAVLGVTHVSKGSKNKEPLERVTGSLAFSAVARIVFITVKVEKPIDDNSPSYLLIRAKSNIGPIDNGIGYSVCQAQFPHHAGMIETALIKWHPQIFPGSPKDLINWAQGTSQNENLGEAERVCNFLIRILSNGPVLVSEIERQANEEGIAISALKRAKSKLGIAHKKQHGMGPHPPTAWFFPDETSKYSELPSKISLPRVP